MQETRVTALALFLLVSCATSAPTANPQAQKVDPAVAGWNPARLADVVAYVASQKSTGLVIIDHNRIVAEQNWPLPDDAETFRANFVYGTVADGALLEDVASQQKSFIAILAGVAIDKGLLDISKPVSAYAGVGWSKALPEQEAKITVRNLLEMNSGLKENLTYEITPDAKFFYNTPAYAIMKPVLEGASKQPLNVITRDWLTAPTGMLDTSWRKRPFAASGIGNPTGLVTTPRDIVCMGQLVLDGGKARNGKRVISKAQLDALFVPTATNPAYGRLWWLNGRGYAVGTEANSSRSSGPLIAAAPPDLVAAQGAQGRRLYVVPSLQLVVVRTGQQTPDRDFNEQLWTRLMKAAPNRQPRRREIRSFPN